MIAWHHTALFCHILPSSSCYSQQEIQQMIYDVYDSKCIWEHNGLTYTSKRFISIHLTEWKLFREGTQKAGQSIQSSHDVSPV